MYIGRIDRTNRPALPRWFVFVLVLLFVGQSVLYTVKAVGHRSAIQRWRDQLLHLSDQDIYLAYNYPNPPIMAILLQPIAQLPPLLGALCWFYFKLGLTLVVWRWVFHLVESHEQPFPSWAKMLTILLSLRAIMGDLSHGNVNLFILFLVVAGLYAFHRGRDSLAGAVLALSIACKVTPALFVPYFLWKRAWRWLAGCAIGLILFLVAGPGVYLGAERNITLLRSWGERMVTPFLIEGTVTSDHLNQSLPGLVFRLTTHNPSIVDEEGKPAQYANLVDWNTRTAGWLIKACMVGFVGLAVWVCRTPLTPRQGWRLAAEFSLVILGMLLFSERTWKHHCVTLVLPFAVLSYYLAAGRPGRALRVYLIGSLVLTFLLMTSTSTTGIGFLASVDEMAKQALVYGAFVWADLVLVTALVVLLRQKDATIAQQYNMDQTVQNKRETLSVTSAA